MGEDIELYFKESGQFIGYQEMEMDSKYLDVHEDISYLKDSVSLHSHIFYEILFCRSGNIQYLIGDMRYQLQPNDIIFVPPGVSHRPIFGEQLTEPYLRTALWVSADYWKKCSEELNAAEWEEKKERQEKSYIIRTNGAVLYQFQKIFEELYKIVTQRRLIEAKKLIVDGVLLKSIPELCGFSDYSVFYKAFVKEYGISPKEFRTMVRGEQYD